MIKTNKDKSKQVSSIKQIVFPPIHIKVNENEAAALRSFKYMMSTTSNDLTHDYVYNQKCEGKLDTNNLNANDKHIKSFILHYKKLVKEAYGWQKLEHFYDIVINDIVKTTDLTHPACKERNRIKQFNDYCVRMFLDLLHNLYYIDTYTLTKNTENLNYYINIVYPIIYDLHNKLMNIVKQEFNNEYLDLYEKSK